MQNNEANSTQSVERQMNNVLEMPKLEFGYSKDTYSIKELSVLAEMYARSGYFPNSNDINQAKAQAFTLMHSGLELGLPPSVAIRNIYFYNGNLEMKSQLALMLVKRHPSYDYKILTPISLMHDKCEIEFFQNGKSLGISNFNMEMAKTAGLVKPNSGYAKYPHAMMFARSVMLGVRLYCSDIGLGGVYFRETLPDGTVEREIPDSNNHKNSNNKKPEVRHEDFKTDAIKEYQNLQNLLVQKEVDPISVFPEKLWHGLLKYQKEEKWQNVLNGSRYLVGLLKEFNPESNYSEINSSQSNQEQGDKIIENQEKAQTNGVLDSKNDIADRNRKNLDNVYDYLENSIDSIFEKIELSKHERAWVEIKPSWENLRNTIQIQTSDDAKKSIDNYISTIKAQFQKGGIIEK